MSEDPITAFLTRAGAVLRELAEPGWDVIADAVVDAVHATPRSGWPLSATTLDPDPNAAVGGATSVSDLVLRGALARALRLDELCIPTLIEVAVEGPALKSVRIELTARYGDELRSITERVRAVTREVIEDLLGGGHADDAVDVVVTDLADVGDTVDTGDTGDGTTAHAT